MTHSTIAQASDRVMAQLLAGLELEFGQGAGEALARRFLDAEEVDFLWDARVEERWLGTYAHWEGSDMELDRVAILARLDGSWIAATLIIDGDGNPRGITARRDFRSRKAATAGFVRAI